MSPALENDQICRTCLSESQDMTCVFNKHEMEHAAARVCDLIFLCASVQIHDGDGLPEQVCSRCIDEIKRAFTFRELCEKSDATLRDKLTSSQIVQDHDGANANHSENELDNVMKTIKQEKQEYVNCGFKLEVTDYLVNKQDVDAAERSVSHAEVQDSGNDNNKSISNKIKQCNGGNKGDEKCNNDSGKEEHNGSIDDCNPLDARKHQEIDAGKNIFSCNECNRSYSLSRDLTRHSWTHSNKGEKLFECNACGKKFLLKRYLHQHQQRTCNNKKDYLCKVCGSTLASNRNLQLHLKRHNRDAPSVTRSDDKEKSTSLQCANKGERLFECNVCRKKFLHKRYLHQHQRRVCEKSKYFNETKQNPPKKSYPCKVCGLILANKRNLQCHLMIHNRDDPSVTLSDDKEDPSVTLFDDKEKSTSLQSANIIETLFECNVCVKKFSHKRYLYEHQQRICNNPKYVNNTTENLPKSKKSYLCIVCGKTLANNRNLEWHLLTHSRDAPMVAHSHGSYDIEKSTSTQCNICGESYSDVINLIAHREKHRQSEDPPLTQNDNTEKPFKCTECGKAFTFMRYLRQHQYVHIKQAKTLKKRFHCSDCGKRFSYLKSLRSHERLVHKKYANIAAKGPLPCNVCGMEYNTSAGLLRHCAIAHGIADKNLSVKSFLCNICGKAFATNFSLRTHMHIHTGEKPYKCSVCDKRFTSDSNRRAHLRVHTLEKPYRCNICNQRFTHSGERNVHVKKHSGVKSHKCKLCGKAYLTGHGLLGHINSIHSNERPYVCKECGKGFVSGSILKDHMTTHSEERPHLCSVCGKGFKRDDHLKTHMKVHRPKK